MIMHKSVYYNKVIITGLGRSGTSAVASIFKFLGYYMPSAGMLATNEDKVLRALLKDGNVAEFVQELNNRAAKNTFVAYKDPKIFGVLGEKVLDAIDNEWLCIIVFRDPVSIAMRNKKSLGVDFDQAFERAVNLQVKLFKFYKRIKQSKPIYLVSYEKLMTNKDAFLEELLSVLGFSFDQDDLDAIKSCLDSDHKRYLVAQPENKC